VTLDANWLIVSLIPSGIGFVLFVYGKKQQRWPQLVGGIAMMVYPYFTPTITSMLIIGMMIGAAVYWAVREDW
jgi:hypothetical protein